MQCGLSCRTIVLLRQLLFSRPLLFVTIVYIVLAIASGGPALFSNHALSGESMLEHDPVYVIDRNAPLPPLPLSADPTPICIDYPCALAFARGLHAGRFDSWNDLTGTGVPLGVEQCGLFFPLKLLYYLAPSPWTYDLFRVLRLAFAAVGTYLLARTRGLPLGPAFVAGALFELSGTLAAFVTFGNASAPYMAPWLLLVANRLIHVPGPKVAIAAAVIIGMTGLSGHPTFLMYAWGMFFLAWLVDLIPLVRDRRRLLKVMGWSLVAGLLGLAFAAPWFLPFYELVQVGATYKDTAEAAVVRAGKLAEVRELFTVGLFGPSAVWGDSNVAVLTDYTPWSLGAVLGSLTFALAIGGILMGALTRATGVTLLIGVTMTLAPPGLRWLYNAPGFRLLLPWYAWFLVALPVALAAGEAVWMISRKRGRWRLLGAAVSVVFMMSIVAWWLPRSRSPLIQPADWAQKAAGSLYWAFAAHGALLILAIGMTISLWRRRPHLAATLVSTLSLAELAAANWRFPRPDRSPALSTVPPVVAHVLAEQAKTHGRFAAPGRIAYPNTPAIFGIADFRSVSAMSLRRERSYFSLIYPPGTTFHVPVRPGSPFLDVAAVSTWIEPTSATQPAAPLLAPGYSLAFEGPASAVYTNENALPRARIVHQATFVLSEIAALGALRGMQRRGRDALVNEVVLQGRKEEVSLSGGAVETDEHVEFVSVTDPDEIVLQARLRSDGLVFLADAYYPGWHARVDGREQPIFPANLAFRAVAVPAGEHTVEFHYVPTQLYRGFQLAGLASALCLVLWWSDRRRRPRSVRE